MGNKEGSAYKLVHAVLMLHPRAKDKMEGMTGIKVDRSEKGHKGKRGARGRGFWIVKGDKAEDCSIHKCINTLDTPTKVGESAEWPFREPNGKLEGAPDEHMEV